MNKFDVIFLAEAREFLFNLEEKIRDKIIFNARKAKIKNDKELFKKLEGVPIAIGMGIQNQV